MSEKFSHRCQVNKTTYQGPMLWTCIIIWQKWLFCFEPQFMNEIIITMVVKKSRVSIICQKIARKMLGRIP
jgi:hypothetical protein